MRRAEYGSVGKVERAFKSGPKDRRNSETDRMRQKKEKTDLLKRAKEVLRIESEAIACLIDRVNDDFMDAIRMIDRCKGRIVVTGIGKPGIIGRKISATLASIGIPSLFLHPAEAIHGDLGMVTKEDVILALSNSGETEELVRLISFIKEVGTKLISLTGNTRSTLAAHSDVTLDVNVKEEACPLGLAPTASSTAVLAMGDALALAVAEKRGFKAEDYARYHPGGSLGKRLMKVEDIMRTGRDNPIVHEKKLVSEVLLAITGARAGCASIVDDEGRLVGIFTDGDLRRHIKGHPDLLRLKVREVMTSMPITIAKGRLVQEAMRIIKEKRIDEIPVVQDGKPIGLIDVQDLLK